jgi:MICOS complex subunit MIC60
VGYALKSDNFHDFFTEYVPFGEDAVLYFEEREFRKRFPRALAPSSRSHPGDRITIPGKSGLSWTVTQSEQEGTDINQKGPHMSAVNQGQTSSSSPSSGRSASPQPPKKESLPSQAAPPTADQSGKTLAKDHSIAAKPAAKEQSKAAVAPTASTPARTADGAKKMPEVNEPSIYIPVSRIDPLNIQNANEPVVQDLVKVLNDIILVINADKSSAKMASSVEKAKAELTKIGQKILDLKKSAQSSADAKMKSSEAEFETAARELVRRLESEIHEQEGKWRDEFESERQKISKAYEDRLSAEIKKINETSDQQSRNRLLEQAISLKKDFTSEVKQIVETERNGRLAKLSELSSSVEELENLASAWNSVIDTNLQTQHLQVAVEAVRANIERSGGRPFIKELAALKEIAVDDSVISSAIASINPVAYQRGIPTSAQLIDRFRNVADEVRKASLLPEDAGVASHAASYLVSKVLFKKQGRAVGDDVESVLTRTETLLEEGSLDEAAREMNTLTGWAKTLSRDWLGEVRRVLEVRQALDVSSYDSSSS